MKHVILKVPSLVFTLLIFSPLIIWYLGIDIEIEYLVLTYRIIPSLVLAIWTLSLIAYMSSESKSKQYVGLSKIITVGQTLIHLIIPLISETNPFYKYWFYIDLFALLLLFINALLITRIVKKVFYARSLWFLFIEVLVIPIGVFTLTPDVKKWEKSDKT